MYVDLRTLKPNPFRDFRIDPIDPVRVDALLESINEDGFWGGISCRQKPDGTLEIGAGHHRIEAVLKSKSPLTDRPITHADVFVGTEIDDEAMVRIYARENATQRGNVGTALAGSVMAAVKIILEKDLSSLEIKRTGGPTRDGIGQDRIFDALHGVPGITDNVIRQQLSSLKASGDYDRVVDEIVTQVEAKNRAAIEALEKAEHERAVAEQKAREAEIARQAAVDAAARARKEEAKRRAEEKAAKDAAAAELARKRADEAQAQYAKAEEARKHAEAEKKAADEHEKAAKATEKKHAPAKSTRDAVSRTRAIPKHDVTFDYPGVAKHLTNASHIETFRKIVTSKSMKPYLSVEGQAGLAEKLVADAKYKERELTSAFLNEKTMELLMEVRATERGFADKEKAEMLRKDWETKAKLLQEEFSRDCRGMLRSAMNLADHTKKRPHGVTFFVSGEFKTAIANVEKAVALLKKEGVV
jgi:hypothetical protein